MSTSNYFSPYAPTTAMCDYCGVRPKYGNHQYCGKTCATEGSKWKPSTTSTSTSTSTAQPLNYQWAPPPPPPNYTQGQSELAYYGPTYDSNAPNKSNMCENCGKRGKSWESKEDGSIVQHRYCGILCHEASRSTPPASIIPAPAPVAAASRADAITLREEGSNAPIGRKILLMMQERWDSNNVSMTKLKSIYRVDLPGKIYRRFDFALQANDGCTVVTTYYGGKAACDIADDSSPAPCILESCAICEALRTAFSQMIYGASSVDGVHGPGLYTFTNPALAHQAAGLSSSKHRSDTNFVLIQCRVVTRGNAAEVSNPYAGFADDSGIVFCSQPMAIIPTHLLVYRARTTVPGGAPPTRSVDNSIGQPVFMNANPPNRDRPRRGALAPPAPRRTLPRAPTPPTRPLRLPSPSGDRSKLGLRNMYSAVPPPKRRRPGVTFIDVMDSSTQQADVEGKKDSVQDDTAATSSQAPLTTSVDTVTVEPPRRSPVLASPRPTRRVVLDPAYIPLPPSPSPDDPPVKKVKKVAKSETKQGPSRDEDAVQPPRSVQTQNELPSTSNAVEGSVTSPLSYFSDPPPQEPEHPLASSSLFTVAGRVRTRNTGRIYDFESDEDGVPARKKPLPTRSLPQVTAAQAVPPDRICTRNGVRIYHFGSDEDGVPARKNPLPTQSLPQANAAQALPPSRFGARNTGRIYDFESDEDGVPARKNPLPTQSLPQDTAAQALPPSTICDNCHLIPKFGGFDYCSKTCASEAERAQQDLSPSRGRSGWVTFGETSGVTPLWGNNTPAYPTRREPTPPSDESSAFATVVPSRQRLATPLWYPWNAPANDQEQADTPPVRESRAYADFVIPPRIATPQRISETSWFGGGSEPNTATSGTPDNSEPSGLTPRLDDERADTSAPYVPPTGYSLPTPVIAPAMLGMEEPAKEDDGLSLTSTVHRLAPRDTRGERGRGGDPLSLIKKWAKVGSEMRKGKNKD